MDAVTWTPVPGFEFIEVTRCGRVRSAAHEVVRMSRHGFMQRYRFNAREMRVWEGDNGYLRCVIQRNDPRRSYVAKRSRIEDPSP